MKNKGITLIALVITIIILIILAGVTINLTIGENGLFAKAQIAVENYKKDVAKEKLEIAIYELTINKQRTPELSELKEITDKDIEIQLDLGSNVEIFTENNKNYALAKVDGYYFKIYDDMVIGFLRKLSPEELEEPEYIKEGLVVWYDGINNTRTGHSNTTDTWENLVEDANNGTLKNIDFNNVSGWTNNSLILDGVNDWVQMAYLYYDNMTVEIVAKPLDVNITAEHQYYISNGENGGICVWKNANNTNEGVSYSNGSKVYSGGTSTENIKINQIYSMSTSYDGTTMYFNENDKLYTKEQSDSVLKPQNSTLYAIGTNLSGSSEDNISGSARGNIEVYSVRIYNRALTQEEIKHNYEIDKERFNIIQLPEQEELDYVKDGLVCLYDGEQNTKYGHSKKTATWQNLTGTVNMTLKNINHTSESGWTNNSIIFDGSNDWGVLNAYMHYSNMTIEIVAKQLSIKTSGTTNYWENYLANTEAGGIAIYKASDNKLSSCGYIGGSYKYLYSDNVVDIGKIYSLSAGYNGSEQYLRENEVMYKNSLTGTFGNPASSTRFVVATEPSGVSEGLSSSTKRANIEVYSVRIYNRCLTEEEIQANYLIDKQRFNIE